MKLTEGTTAFFSSVDDGDVEAAPAGTAPAETAPAETLNNDEDFWLGGLFCDNLRFLLPGRISVVPSASIKPELSKISGAVGDNIKVLKYINYKQVETTIPSR